MSFCIPNFPLSALVPLGSGVISLDGLRVYEGACSARGPLVGAVSGTFTLETSGPGPFSMMLIYTVGFPGLMSYRSEWSFTGLASFTGTCSLQNVVSDGSVRSTGLAGIGLDVDLHLVGLEPGSGACSSEKSIVWLPTFVYSVSPAQTVCAIQLGVKEPNGTLSWLPGYGYPDLLPSECQNKTEVLGQDVLGRTIVLHQFNQTM